MDLSHKATKITYKTEVGEQNCRNFFVRFESFASRYRLSVAFGSKVVKRTVFWTGFTIYRIEEDILALRSQRRRGNKKMNHEITENHERGRKEYINH